MKRLIFLICLFFILSCSNVHKYIWIPKKEVTNQEFNYDYGNCILDAKQAAAWAVGSSKQPADLGFFDSFAWQETYNKTFNDCMKKKGYIKEKR